MLKAHLMEFFEFIRKQGVISLAIGFILGGAVTKLVTALVTDFINPIVGLFLGSVDGLKAATLKIGSAVILWGDFATVLIDFIIVSLVVYVGVKIFKLDRLDKKD